MKRLIAPARETFDSLTRDGRLLFASRALRLFAYGAISVVLVFYLAELGMSEKRIGLLLTLTLVGDTVISLVMATRADRVGRRKILILGALLMAMAAAIFLVSTSAIILLIAATIGVISPSGNEVGPFLAVEQASLSHVIADNRRTGVFAWYTVVGSFATAFGALAAGASSTLIRSLGMQAISGYRITILAYALTGLMLVWLFKRLSPAIEVMTNMNHLPDESDLLQPVWGLHRSRRMVMKLSGLFALDAFAGGFIIQSFMAYWFHVRFGADLGTLGAIFFAANLLAGLSALVASRLASRFGLINTMVFTHLPSNALLILVPLMPNLPLAIAVLLLRFSISQMDVPARQSYTMAIVAPEERSAAAGITGVARTAGASLSPMMTGAMLGHAGLFAMPFFLAGGLKILYDLLLLRSTRSAGIANNDAH